MKERERAAARALAKVIGAVLLAVIFTTPHALLYGGRIECSHRMSQVTRQEAMELCPWLDEVLPSVAYDVNVKSWISRFGSDAWADVSFQLPPEEIQRLLESDARAKPVDPLVDRQFLPPGTEGGRMAFKSALDYTLYDTQRNRIFIHRYGIQFQ